MFQYVYPEKSLVFLRVNNLTVDVCIFSDDVKLYIVLINRHSYVIFPKNYYGERVGVEVINKSWYFLKTTQIWYKVTTNEDNKSVALESNHNFEFTPSEYDNS